MDGLRLAWPGQGPRMQRARAKGPPSQALWRLVPREADRPLAQGRRTQGDQEQVSSLSRAFGAGKSKYLPGPRVQCQDTKPFLPQPW